MEVALGHCVGAIELLEIAFQSLFSWKSPSDWGTIRPYFRSHLVSILVFVEVALGPRTVATIKEAIASFQSLFSWKSPSDCACGIKGKDEMKFQSLFSWKSPSDGLLVVVLDWLRGVSILVFVEVALGLYQSTRYDFQHWSFNPCFRGSRPRTVDFISIPCEGRMFQSLFSWKSPSDLRQVSHDL